MKKVSLAEIEKDGWKVSAKDRDKIAAVKMNQEVVNTALLIVDSLNKIVKKLDKKPDGTIEIALAQQSEFNAKIIKQIQEMIRKLKVENPEVVNSWKFKVERDSRGRIDEVYASRID